MLAQHVGGAVFAVPEQYNKGVDQGQERGDALTNWVVETHSVAYKSEPAYTHGMVD
jgi:hypothetical protein